MRGQASGPGRTASQHASDGIPARASAELGNSGWLKQLTRLAVRKRPEEKTMCLGIPGKVTNTYREHDVLMGKVDFGGVFKRVCLEHVPEAQIGEYVIVHVGFALSRIDEAEARHVFEFLEGMNELDELKREVPMKYLDEYRDPAAAGKLRQAIASRHHQAVDDHGSLRRADAHDRQVRHRRAPAAGN